MQDEYSSMPNSPQNNQFKGQNQINDENEITANPHDGGQGKIVINDNSQNMNNSFYGGNFGNQSTTHNQS